MKTSWWVLWLLAPMPVLAQRPPLPPEPRPVLDPLAQLRQSIRYWERQLAQDVDLQAKGAGSERTVEEARVTLAKLRHNLAQREDKHEAALEQSQAILTIRDKQVKRLQGLAEKGFATELELTEARRRAACAGYFVAREEGHLERTTEQLRRVIEQSKKEVGLLKQRRNQTVSIWELHRAENRVICAEYLLAQIQGTPEEAARELRRHVEVCEDEWKKVVDLRAKGAALYYEVYLVRENLLNAKLRLANVEQDRGAMAEQLRGLIKLHEETLARGRILEEPLFPAEANQHFRNAVQDALDLDRYRLKQVRAGNPIDDLAAATLDS